MKQSIEHTNLKLYGKYICWLVLFNLASCNEKKNTTASNNEKAIQNTLKVSMEIKVLEDDTFQLFYFEDSSQINYEDNKRIAKPIKGKDGFQLVEFILPQNIIPSKFRIDVGENGFLSPVEIKNIQLNYNNNLIDIENTVFDRFFKTNIFLENSEKGFVRKQINGRYDPFFASKALLIKKMKIEFLINNNSFY